MGSSMADRSIGTVKLMDGVDGVILADGEKVNTLDQQTQKVDNMIDGNPWVDEEKDTKENDAVEPGKTHDEDGVNQGEDAGDAAGDVGDVDGSNRTSIMSPSQLSQPPTTTLSTSPSASSQPPPKLSITSNPIDISEFDPFASTPSIKSYTTPINIQTNDNTPTIILGPISSTSNKPPALPTRKITTLSSVIASPSPTSRALPSPKAPQQISTGPIDGSGDGNGTAEREDIPQTPIGPVFDFQGFLTDLRGKSAESVARYLKRCVRQFLLKKSA
jgi:hypothetical protein